MYVNVFTLKIDYGWDHNYEWGSFLESMLTSQWNGNSSLFPSCSHEIGFRKHTKCKRGCSIGQNRLAWGDGTGVKDAHIRNRDGDSHASYHYHDPRWREDHNANILDTIRPHSYRTTLTIAFKRAEDREKEANAHVTSVQFQEDYSCR